MAVRSNSMLKLADTATTIKPILLAITIRLPYLVTIAATEIAVVDFDRFNFDLSFTFYYYSL